MAVDYSVNSINIELDNMYLQTMNDVLHHDVLEGEKGKPGPMLKNTGVEAAGIVASEKHRLKVRTTIGCNNDN